MLLALVYTFLVLGDLWGLQAFPIDGVELVERSDYISGHTDSVNVPHRMHRSPLSRHNHNPCTRRNDQMNIGTYMDGTHDFFQVGAENSIVDLDSGSHEDGLSAS